MIRGGHMKSFGVKSLFVFGLIAFNLGAFSASSHELNTENEQADAHYHMSKTINRSTLNQWTGRYQKAFPNRPHGHTFGKNALSQLLQNNDSKELHIAFGHTPSQYEQLIFRTSEFTRFSQNESSQDTLPPSFGDATQCPLFCPHKFPQQKIGGFLVGDDGEPTNISSIVSLGREIDSTIGESWIENSIRFNQEVRLPTRFNKNDILRLISDVFMGGVYFAYGLDDDNNTQLIAMGVTREGALLHDLVFANKLELLNIEPMHLTQL